MLDERQLAHAMFPLGDTLTTKDEIRAEAERRGLAVAKKPDSHDICFIADGDTQGFLARRLGTAEGDIVDEEGTQVGTHDGAYGFTIGQRKGLRIGQPAADGKPRYVLDISPVDNTVTVGPVEALDVAALTAIRPRWCGTAPAGPGPYTAQLRAHGGETEVTAELVDGELRVTFAEPVRGVAPGQAIVLYDGTRVVGSATIATTERTTEPARVAPPAPPSTPNYEAPLVSRSSRQELLQDRDQDVRGHLVRLARQGAVAGPGERRRQGAGRPARPRRARAPVDDQHARVDPGEPPLRHRPVAQDGMVVRERKRHQLLGPPPRLRGDAPSPGREQFEPRGRGARGRQRRSRPCRAGRPPRSGKNGGS